MNPKLELLQQVREHLEGHGLRLRPGSDATLRATITGRSAMYPLWVQALDEPLMLLLTMFIPLVVPEEQRRAMAETLTRANCGLRLGGFQLDMSAGMLRFQAATIPVNACLDETAVGTMIQAVTLTTDRYFPAFARLMYGDDLSPAEVIAEIEMAETAR